MSNEGRFTHLDSHVRRAFQTQAFTDGAPIKLRGDREQAFIVSNEGIFEVQATASRTIRCGGKGEVVYQTFNPGVFAGHAGGHTHPDGVEQFLGPRDDMLAKATFAWDRLAYVIMRRGAYAIEFDGERYNLRTVTGSSLNEERVAKKLGSWLTIKPPRPGMSRREIICQGVR